VNANVVQTVLQLAYAVHDRRRYAEGRTGFSLVASLFKRIQEEEGRRPREIVIESWLNVLRGTVDRDTNYALTVEGMAVFGLPLRVAVRHSHIGFCAELLAYDVTMAACFLGTAVANNFEARGGTGAPLIGFESDGKNARIVGPSSGGVP
jgi:hypothetical protein